MALPGTELYAQLLYEQPMLTKSLTSSTLFGFSDLLAQLSEQPRSDSTALVNREINARRVTRFMICGLGSGVCWHLWYGVAQGWTDALIPYGSLDPNGQALATTALGIVLEQFVMCPVYFSLYLLPVVSLQSGIPPSDIPNEIRKKLPDLLVQNAKVWTPANVVIYNVPIEWRCLASNTVDVLWGIICSTMVNCAVCDDVEECAVETEMLEVDEEMSLVSNPLAPASEEELCGSLVPRNPAIARGRGLPRLAMRRVRRQFEGMGHAVWELRSDSDDDMEGRVVSSSVKASEKASASVGKGE